MSVMVLPIYPTDDADPGGGDRAGAIRDRKGLRLGCAAFAVPAIAVVVCAGLTLARCVAPSLLGPRTETVAVTGSAVLERGGRMLLYTADAPCRRPVLNARETATTVSVTLTETDAGLEGCERGLPAQASSGTTVGLFLTAPLGSRRLVDATTGRPIPYLAEDDALRPRQPMVGWSSGPIDDPFLEVSTAMPYFGGPGSAVLVEQFTATTGDTGSSGRDQIFVVQVAGGGWHPPPGTAQRPVTVRGHAGVAAAGIVVWPEAGRTVAVMGVLAAPVAGILPGPPIMARLPGGPPPDGAPMPTDRLLAFAETLVGGGS